MSSKPDVAALLKQADSLLDESVPKIDQAIALLREVIAAEPDHVYALHNLSWCLDVTRRFNPADWEQHRTEHWRLRDKILVLTAGTTPGGTLSLEQKARALALSQWAQDAVVGRLTPGQLVEVEAALDEATRLRDIPDHQRGRRGLEAWRVLHQDREAGYRVLLALIEKTPNLRVHGVTGDAHRENFAGLQGVFSDAGFIAWLREQIPAARPGGAAGDALDQGFLLAAGLDAAPYFGRRGQVGGRVGRILALRALGADVRALDRDKHTALHLAAMIGDVALVNELLAMGVEATALDSGGATALYRTTEYDHAACIAPLVAGGVPVDAVDEGGRTALFQARSVDAARALLDAGADPNGGAGWTPLHMHARFKERVAVVEVLLAAGADPTRKNRAGQTAAREALAMNNPAVAELLVGDQRGSLDVAPLLDALAERSATLAKRWYFEDDDVSEVERVLQSIGIGARSWDEAAAQLQRESPWTAMAIVELARDVLPAEVDPPAFQGAPRFVRGNLVVNGNLELAAPLLVTGDLVVEGIVRNPGPEAMLMVAGSVRVVGLDTSGEVIVGDCLHAKLVWGHYNDNSLRVRGTIKAEVVISDNHDIQADVEATHYFENGNFDEGAPELQDIFVPAAFTEDGLDRQALFELVAGGEPVLR